MSKAKSKKSNRQLFLGDGADGTLEPPSIRAIDEAADALQSAKKKRIDGALKLKEKELTCYDELDKELSKHVEELGPAKTYTYTNSNDKRVTIKYGKPRITIKAAKAEKKASTKQKASSNTIVSGDENLPPLE